MRMLSKNQVLALHAALLEEFGGTDGIRDMGMLESALAAPFQTFGGESLYPSLHGAHVMLVFLALNGIELEYTQQELIDVILSVARGETDSPALLQWILCHEC